MFFTGWVADYPDPENFLDILFHTGSSGNYGGFSSRELDTLLERAGFPVADGAAAAPAPSAR
jgi:ABC-type oligopeptide transport system substrate-binding subunit